MPLKLDVKRKLLARSDRVKCVDLHPVEPWMLCSLYNGVIHVWNYETQTMFKSFETCQYPVRAAKFVPRKNWILSGCDDFLIRVFNYNTLERVHQFEAHGDYIRSIAVHPTQPFFLTSSDDMLIKLWNWDKSWACQQVFESHTHYVMQVVFNPKDNNTFASASLDYTVKVWQLGSSSPNFTLDGHEKGVNCVDYYHGGDKPYIISGGDDRLVKIWDYQNKACVQTLDGHTQNISAVCFHPELPVILSGSEDGTVKIWHANTYRLENTLNYGLERVWTMQALPGSNNVAMGYDEGSILIKLGREEPAISMDASGKIIWAKHSEIQQANLKAISDAEVKDGEKLPLQIKDMGSCEIYPQAISHNPNGRFVVVCGDGEYIIYTAMALRNKSFGSAQEFVWAQDSSEYAVRENSSTVKIFKNFKEKKTFKPEFGADGIFGGFMLGVKSPSGLALFDWENLDLIRRIDIQPKLVNWSENSNMVAICSDESFFILKYNAEAVAQATPESIGEDGIEDAFDVLGEVGECVKTGIWVGDCFIYTNSVNRLNYYVGGEIVSIAHLDRTMYVLGYLPKESRLYLGDKELNVVSYSLLLSVMEYQTAVMRRDFDTADRVLPTIPKEQRTRVAHFLEKQGFKKQALAVSADPEHRFDLALQLGELPIALQLAQEASSEIKWKQLADLALAQSKFGLALQCLRNAQDFAGMMLLATAAGDASTLQQLAENASPAGKHNIAFLSNFLLNDIEAAIGVLERTERLPEAALFAKCFCPSEVSRIVANWKETLSSMNAKAAQAIADPVSYENLFPQFAESLQAEQFLKQEIKKRQNAPAAVYPQVKPNHERRIIEELGESGLHYEIPDFVAPPKKEQQVERNHVDRVPSPHGSAGEKEDLDADEDQNHLQTEAKPVAATAPPTQAAPVTADEMDLLEAELQEEMEKLDFGDAEDEFDLDENDDLR